MNAAFLAMSAANIGLLPLAFSSSPRSYYDDSHSRRNRARREASDAEHARRVRARQVDTSVYPYGLDPEEDAWLIEEIEQARPIEAKIKDVQAYMSSVKRGQHRRYLDPEEDEDYYTPPRVLLTRAQKELDQLLWKQSQQLMAEWVLKLQES